MTEITQADVDAAIEWYSPRESEWQGLLAEHFARHRKYGYDQGYYDGRQFDRMEERAAIVALAAEYMGDIEFAQFKHALNADDQFLDPNHYWYRQGKDDGIEQERGNTVEWLKKRAPAALHDPRMVANAIEAGEHLK